MVLLFSYVCVWYTCTCVQIFCMCMGTFCTSANVCVHTWGSLKLIPVAVIALHLILRQCLSLSPKLAVWASLDIHLAPEIFYLGFQWDHLIQLAFMCFLGIQIGPHICKANTLSTSFPDASFTLESLVLLIYFQYYDWVIRKICNQDYWKPCGLDLDQYMSACLTGLQMRQKPTGTG